jgi:hypothetical protein
VETLGEDKERETSWMFIDSFLLCDVRVCSCDSRVCTMHVNPREEHDDGDDEGYYGSFYSVRVSTLVEDM